MISLSKPGDHVTSFNKEPIHVFLRRVNFQIIGQISYLRISQQSTLNKHALNQNKDNMVNALKVYFI